MDKILGILDEQEEKVSSEVEKIFKDVANTVNQPNWNKFTAVAQEQLKKEQVDKAITELRSIREGYINKCTELISNSKITVSEPQIKDSYTLMSNKYKLIGKPLDKQIEVLSNTTNQNDFDIMKGIILDSLIDETQIRQVAKIELPTEDKLKAQALGHLKFRTANIDFVPGLNISRQISIQSVGGLRNYLYNLFYN